MNRVKTLLLAAILAACGEGSGTAPDAEAPPPRVGVVEAKLRPTPVSFEYGGRVTPVRQVEIRARVTGILLERSYVEGAAVRAGDVLFRIDPAPYQAIVDTAAAQLQEAEATLERARRDQSRTAALFRSGAGSARERDDAASALLQAEASAAAARARLAAERLNLGYTTVVAPIAGVTSLESMSEGSLVGTQEGNSLLTRITQIDPVHVTFAFHEGDLEQLAAGEGSEAPRLRATVLVGEGRMAPEGEVNFREATVDPDTGTVRGRAVFANPDRRLVPGQFVRIRVSGAERDAIRLPQAAIQQDVQGAFVFVVGSDNRAERRAVRLGRTAGRDWIVRDGLAPGERVIAEGVVRVQEGIAVEPAAIQP